MKDYTKSTTGNAAKKPPSRKKAIIIFAVVDLLLLVAVFYFVFFNQADKPQPTPIHQPVSALSETRFENQTLSLDQAYRLTNVDRFPFAQQESNIPESEKKYLSQLFILTDVLVIERVQNYRTGNYKTNNHALTLEEIKKLQPPLGLESFHNKVVSAVETQLSYYKYINNGGSFNSSDPGVQTSHSALLSAYDEILKKYPTEHEKVRQSFFSQLCALDFI